jgi:hypothetical protein
LPFFIKTGGGAGPDGPLYIDDLYLSDSADLELSNPSAAPAAIASGLPRPVPDRLESPRPSPFNPATQLAFTLEKAGTVRPVVHDVTGRQVRELWAGQTAAGRQVMSWDGRDDGGAGVASGVYVLSLVVDGTPVDRGRLVLVRQARHHHPGPEGAECRVPERGALDRSAVSGAAVQSMRPLDGLERRDALPATGRAVPCGARGRATTWSSRCASPSRRRHHAGSRSRSPSSSSSASSSPRRAPHPRPHPAPVAPWWPRRLRQHG